MCRMLGQVNNQSQSKVVLLEIVVELHGQLNVLLGSETVFYRECLNRVFVKAIVHNALIQYRYWSIVTEFCIAMSFKYWCKFYYFSVVRKYTLFERKQRFCPLQVKSPVLKSDSSLPKNLFYFLQSSLKMMKNASFFTLKALFVLKNFCFNFLVTQKKRLGQKDMVNFKIYDVTAWLTKNCNTNSVQYLKK